MPRIRSIKPEFPQSETMGRLSRDARLLFIQLWTVVDDAGRARAASRMLASLLYPYDDDAPKLINKWLTELEERSCIRRYEVDGCSYLDIPNWLKHQKIDRPSESRLPEYREPSTDHPEETRVSDADLGPRTLDQDKDLLSPAPTARLNVWPQNYEEQFWGAYPKKVDKQAAFKGLKRVWKSDAVNWQLLLEAVKRYARSVSSTDRKFIKSPEVWLNKGCWDDEQPSDPSVVMSAPAGKIHVHQESPDWPRYERRYRETHSGKDPPRDRVGGWLFPIIEFQQAAE